jgi:hypothetical protein
MCLLAEEMSLAFNALQPFSPAMLLAMLLKGS